MAETAVRDRLEDKWRLLPAADLAGKLDARAGLASWLFLQSELCLLIGIAALCLQVALLDEFLGRGYFDLGVAQFSPATLDPGD